MSSKAVWFGTSLRWFAPQRVLVPTRRLSSLPVVIALALTGCGSAGEEPDAHATATTEAMSHDHGHPNGEELFETAFHETNGRSCATCHVLEEHTVLRPDSVAERLARHPSDPLFNRIDADDPLAPNPTYDHLAKGLVRVVLNLPDNMDLVDDTGQVVTGPERTVSVWRAVPTVENTAITAPYQYDGRKATLQEQAQGAIIAHSQGGNVARRDLDAIADFQKDQFSSKRASKVAKEFARGIPVEDIERPELHMKLDAAEARGLAVYNAACEACHGGATTRQITNQAVHDLSFVELNADGNVVFDTSVQPPVAKQIPAPDDQFLNIGFGLFTYLGQIYGDIFVPHFNDDVSMPRYRYRFYTDSSRTVKVVDLPPIPVTADGNPFGLTPVIDANGAPIEGPNFLPQAFSTDPGRAAITGNPRDFEGFDVPPLRGIANTAPYFHDNSIATLKDAVDVYSRLVLPFLVPLNLPPVLPPEPGSVLPESLSPQQKQDLLAFLAVL